MRIALGRLLLTRPDIIILDEPTNHLDMPSISWLESFLSSYPGSVIVVSHDRYFIDRIATQIVEIDNKRQPSTTETTPTLHPSAQRSVPI